jgi:2-polyprenyl-6-methoxyphenol hydroxylase-like FAD-dependent oxidoreductase
MTKASGFKVIIAGGGVAGLALANMLEKFDIDYVILEAYKEIECPGGAGIGLMPNGCFLLDQLGLYDAIRAAAQDGEVKNSYIRSSGGAPLITLKHMMYHQERRFVMHATWPFASF